MAVLNKLRNKKLRFDDIDDSTLFTLHLRIVDENCKLIKK